MSPLSSQYFIVIGATKFLIIVNVEVAGQLVDYHNTGSAPEHMARGRASASHIRCHISWDVSSVVRPSLV